MVMIKTTVDGVFYSEEVEPRLLLVHYLRTRLGRTGTVVGCDTSNCGACTVLLDGVSVKSCTVLAFQADGAEITTVQGLAEGELHPVQKAFHENHALQCGYCTAGMIMSAVDLLMGNPDPSEQEVRDGLEGNHLPIATEEVHHLGDAVAVVVAEGAYQAADAVEAVQVEYDPLPAVVDMMAALDPEAPLVHVDKGTNRAFTWGFSAGDYEGAKRRAQVVVSRRFIQQRLLPTAMEPRAVVADLTPATGEFTLWTSTQVPHFVRLLMSSACGIPEQKLRVVAPDVGGGFGGKLNVYAEEAIALAVARRLGRPVKWTATRGEDYQATTHGRDMIQDVEIAATRDGRVLGLKVALTSDMGAYLQLLTPAVPLLGRYMYPGVYKFEAHDFFCQGVFTTKTPTDSYRGAGRPEATFAIERIMDELAAELGMDPLELRQRNWISHTEFPYTTITGLTYDSGNYEAATARAVELFGYDGLRREQAERRQRRDPVQLGIGVSVYTEMGGLAPSRWLGQQGYSVGGWETASVRLLPTGRVEAIIGSTVAMPVLKRLAPVVAGLMLGLIFGMLLGHRRRIVIMTAPAPPGTFPPTRAML